MGLSSSKSKTKTQSTTTSSPLAQFAPYINQGLSSAQGIMDSNQGNMQMLGGKALDVANSFGAPTAALGSIYNGQNPAQATYTRAQNAAANDPSMGILQQLAQGSKSPGQYDGIGSDNPALARLMAMSDQQANGDTSQYYKDVIGGKYLDNNPYVDQMAQQATDAATRAANARFAATGMGEGISTPYTQVLGQSVANANNQLRYQNYNAERGLQNTAAGMSDAQHNATADRNLSAATGLGSLYNQTGALNLSVQQAKDQAFNADRTNQLAAAQGLGGQYNVDNATALNGANGAIQSQLAALGLIPGMTSAQLNALGAAASIPYTGVNNYANLVNGLTGKYGTTDSNSTQTTKTSQSLGSVLGGLAGAGLSAFASGGFGGGGLGSLFGGAASGGGGLMNTLTSGLSPLNLTPNTDLSGTGINFRI